MTSANVTYYEVIELATGKIVGSYSQHCLCKQTIKEKLLSHTPPELFNVDVIWRNEEEEDEEIFYGNLKDWLDGKV